MILKWKMPVTFAKAIWHSIQYVFSGFPAMAPSSVVKDRSAICATCPFKVQDQCSKCACFLTIKVLLSSESCPDQPSKWNRLTFKPRTTTDSSVA